LTGLENNIYAQVAMVMLIGLLGKNAVLIVEFAIQRHAAGKSVLELLWKEQSKVSSYSNDIVFVFIAGLLPLVFATGPGKIGNRTIGTAAAGGMLIGTICGVFVIPGLHLGRIAEKYKLVKVKKKIH
jgi:HAE1 family hydrophobic/amphiphilic exporter-1